MSDTLATSTGHYKWYSSRSQNRKVRGQNDCGWLIINNTFVITLSEITHPGMGWIVQRLMLFQIRMFYAPWVCSLLLKLFQIRILYALGVCSTTQVVPNQNVNTWAPAACLIFPLRGVTKNELLLTVSTKWTWTKVILAVMCTTKAVVKIRPEKNSGLYGIWTHDLCDTGAVSTKF